MARYTGAVSRKVERVEGVLGDIGNARVLLRLVVERVQVASHHDDRSASILAPALDDIRRVDALLVRAQRDVSGGV